MKKIFFALRMSVVLLASMACVSFAAGDYPNRPITIIAPFSPGGLADLMARTVAMSAEKYLGQPLVVVNKPGGGSLIGSLAVAQATPDGYTLLVTHSAITSCIESEIAMGRKPPFTRNDFTTIGSFLLTPGCKVVAYDHPWKTMADLMRDCKARPNQYTYSSAGIHSSIWIDVNLFLVATGLKCRHIPYRGGGEATTAVLGRHADFTVQGITTARSLVEGKKLRILAVGSNQRVKSIPDVPTLEELGIHYHNWIPWTGLLVPKRTPKDIVEKLREVAEKVAKDKKFIDAVEKTGDEVAFMDGDELAKYWDSESEMTAQLYERLAKEKDPSK